MTPDTAHAEPVQQRPTTPAAGDIDDVGDVDQAWRNHQATFRAWAADPASPEALAAYVDARHRLHHARRHAIATAGHGPAPAAAPGSGPTVITPVIEWWSTGP